VNTNALRRLAALLLILTATAASAEIIPFDSDRWMLFNAEIVDHEGRQCLIGSAFLPGVAFTNGVIEYDIMVDGSRGYPGIRFRAANQFDYENFYIRPHVSNRPDALQYTAAFKGVAGWQLYNGPGYTAAAEIPTGEWIHVRLEIKDKRARVYFGDGEEPALVIDDLKHAVAPGSIALTSARDGSVRFADFSVTETDDLDLGPEPRPVHQRGLITEWELSQTFRASDVDMETYPGDGLPEPLDWSPAATEAGGLLDITRYRPRRMGGEADLIFARVYLEAEQDEIRKFTIGYSDYVCAFLNGTPVFTGDSSYKSRNETFSGVVGLHDTLHLSLEKGRNELMLAVVETFGGWGLMGQDNADDYLHPGLEQIWRIDLGNRLPESALYDPDHDLLYVTQYFRGGNEYISRISLTGEVLDREWIAGLSRPTGLIIHGGRLWAVDRSNLVEIDRDAGEIVATHPIPGAMFPNDVAFDDKGNAYVSDTFGHCIHRFADGAWDVWLDGDDIDQPNGLLWDRDRLLYGNQGDGCLKAVDPESRAVTTVAAFGDDTNVDGVRDDGQGGYVVSDFRGRVYRVAAGEVTILLDTTASGAFCADLEYVSDRGLMIVPGLYDNRLTAYRYTDPGD
jgi:sugar lactone lactonase YvrE